MSVPEEVVVACEDFCTELSGSVDTSFHRTYDGDPASRVICQGQSLTLLADLSPLCTGHLLLVSNHHYLSFAEVCVNHLVEVRESLKQIRSLYSTTFGPSVIIEHGSSLNQEGASCITHAHWHILPVEPETIIAAVAKDGLTYVDLRDLSDLTAAAAGNSYYYVSDGNIHRIYRIDRTLPQQYMRSVVGRILGIPDPQWDWALVIRKEHLRTTMRATTEWHLHGNLADK